MYNTTWKTQEGYKKAQVLNFMLWGYFSTSIRTLWVHQWDGTGERILGFLNDFWETEIDRSKGLNAVGVSHTFWAARSFGVEPFALSGRRNLPMEYWWKTNALCLLIVMWNMNWPVMSILIVGSGRRWQLVNKCWKFVGQHWIRTSSFDFLPSTHSIAFVNCSSVTNCLFEVYVNQSASTVPDLHSLKRSHLSTIASSGSSFHLNTSTKNSHHHFHSFSTTS